MKNLLLFQLVLNKVKLAKVTKRIIVMSVSGWRTACQP